MRFGARAPASRVIRHRSAPGPAQTRITALQLGGTVSDGVLRTDRMIGEIPFIRLNGNGTLDLLEQGLNYRLDAKVYETPTFADGETLGRSAQHRRFR